MLEVRDLNLGSVPAARLRREFPLVETCTYLDSAYNGPLPLCARNAMASYLDRWHQSAYADGRFADWLAHAERVRAKVAELLGVQADEVMFTRGTTDGLATVATALLRPGDQLLIGGLDHPADYATWFQLQASGVDVRPVRSRAGRMLVEDFATAIGPHTRAVGACLVNTYNGHRLDLAGLSGLCRERGVYLLLDGIQAVGCLDVKPGEHEVAILSAGAQKWLCSSRGLGVAYVSRRLSAAIPTMSWWTNVRPTNYHGWGDLMGRLLDADAAAAETPAVTYVAGARRFESSLQFLALHGLEAVVDLLLAVGMANVEQRILALTTLLTERLLQVGVDVLSPNGPQERSGIVALRVSGAADFIERCRECKVYVTPTRRVDGGSGGSGGSGEEPAIRVSPHVFNDERDVDAFVDVLESHVRRTGGG